MEYIILGSKLVLFVSIINVWFFRFSKPTPFRGSNASNMKEEFAAYGLSEAMVYTVGALKILAAIGLLVSIWVPTLAVPAAATMGLLMLGAIGMHLKVRDPLQKSLPAFIFFLLSLLIWLSGTGQL
jgi:hypothetical protein